MPMSRCCFYLDFLMGWIMIMASMGMDCTLAKEMNTHLQLSGTALPTTRNLLCLYGIGIVQVLPNRGGKMGPLYPDVSQAAYEIAPNNGKVSCLCPAEVKCWRQTTNVEPCCLTNDSRWGGSCHSTCKKNITHWYLTLVAFKVISEEYCAYAKRPISVTSQSPPCGYGAQPSHNPVAWWWMIHCGVIIALWVSVLVHFQFHRQCTTHSSCNSMNVCVPTRWWKADSLYILPIFVNL